jgi:Endonuclease-reverse transcriptase
VGRYAIGGFDLITATPDAKFGRATYVRSDITDASPISSSTSCDIIQVGRFKIANVYKPPSVHWDPSMLPTLQHPAVYVGDYNSHHPEWGYPDPDEDGELLVEWATNNDLSLTQYAKQRGTFHSARWQKDYSQTSVGSPPEETAHSQQAKQSLATSLAAKTDHFSSIWGSK